MSWFNFGGVSRAVWGAVTRPFAPPPPPVRRPVAPTMPHDATRIQSGGVERLRQSSLIDWRYPPIEGSGGLVHNNAGSLIGNNAAGSNRPWWQRW